MVHKTTTIGLNSYLQSSGDRILQAVLHHEKKKKFHSLVKEGGKFKFQNSLRNEDADVDRATTHQWLSRLSLKGGTEGSIFEHTNTRAHEDTNQESLAMVLILTEGYAQKEKKQYII